MPVSRRVVGGDERAPRVAGPQQHGLSAATSESSVSATTRHGHGPRPRVVGELVRIAATMALRTHASPTSSLSLGHVMPNLMPNLHAIVCSKKIANNSEL